MKAIRRDLAGRTRNLLRTIRTTIVLGSLAACVSAYAADDKAPNFVFVDPSVLTVSPSASGAFKLDFPVKNSGAKEGEGSLVLLGEKGKGCQNATVAGSDATLKLAINEIAIAHFEIAKAEAPTTCYIELSTKGAGGGTSLKQVKLTQKYLTPAVTTPLYWCLWISGAVALLAGAITCLVLKIWTGPFFNLGTPAWEFAKSWFSTTTVLGGIFTTIVTFSALPELTRYASKSGYAVLSLLISLAVVVAPFAFVALRWGSIEEDANTHQPGVVYRGCLWAFVVSCAITLFAGLAQLVVVFLVVREVFDDSDPWSFDSGTMAAFGLGFLLCAYVGSSMFLTIKMQKTENERPKEEQHKEIQEGKFDGPHGGVKGVKARSLPWPVL